MVNTKENEEFLEEENEEQQELYEHFKFIVDKGQSLLRVDKFLSQKLRTYHETGFKALPMQEIFL